MTDPTFGQLTKLAPRDYWPDEAVDFTPWLAEEANITLLGVTIGIELVVEGVEATVGSFSADIICRSLPDEHRVVISPSPLRRRRQVQRLAGHRPLRHHRAPLARQAAAARLLDGLPRLPD
ncbi:MAG: hypothetical protein OXE43_11825 [Chloroflexi bacterium]|nr:hypothetical protein [Chloroflexota bacterium]